MHGREARNYLYDERGNERVNESRKPIVVLDCDGVLANWAGAFCTEAAIMAASHTDYFGDKYKFPQFKVYDSYNEIEHYASEKWPGWTEELCKRVWAKVNATPDWFFNVAPICPTRNNVWALIKLTEQTQLYVVTARHQGAGKPINELTQHWIEEHFNAHTSVIAANGHTRKVDIIEALQPDYLIDDSPDILRAVRKRDPQVKLAARAYPYNVGCVSDTRVGSVEEFYDWVMHCEWERAAA